MLTAVAVDSQMINRNSFSYQQVIHKLHSLQAPEKKVLDLYSQARERRISPLLTNWPAKPYQVSAFWKDRHINDSDQEKQVIHR
jgi:hypothetical protein